MRIVSLLPAATEIVAALGALDDLVGVTHECDFPAGAAARPRVTSSAVDAERSAADVNAAVAALAASGSDVFTLDGSLIADLTPEVILTQKLCDVCAVSETDVRAMAARLDPTPRVITLGGTTLDGVFDDVSRVGAAIGHADAASALVASLVARLRYVHETLKIARAPRPRVVIIEWTEPAYVAGHWVPEMVRRAGGVDAVAQPGEHSRPRELAELAAAAPDVVVIAPCGYDVLRAAEEARRVLAHSEWSWATGRAVWAIDANGLVSRPGPRLVDGVETLAAMFNPSLFPRVDPGRALRIA